MKFDFQNNDRWYRGDFFTTKTISHGLSTGGVRIEFRSTFVGPIFEVVVSEPRFRIGGELLGSDEWI